MVSDTNAVPHPWTVVVHPQDALLAQLAVMGTSRFHGLASLAIRSFLQLRYLRGAE
jgi:hypothetical protein